MRKVPGCPDKGGETSGQTDLPGQITQKKKGEGERGTRASPISRGPSKKGGSLPPLPLLPYIPPTFPDFPKMKPSHSPIPPTTFFSSPSRSLFLFPPPTSEPLSLFPSHPSLETATDVERRKKSSRFFIIHSIFLLLTSPFVHLVLSLSLSL